MCLHMIMVMKYLNWVDLIKLNYLQINNLTVIVKGVEVLLKKLKINKASGQDDLPEYMLNELADESAPILIAIYMQSLHDSWQ